IRPVAHRPTPHGVRSDNSPDRSVVATSVYGMDHTGGRNRSAPKGGFAAPTRSGRLGSVEQPDGPTNAETRQAKSLSGLGGRTRADAPNQMRHVFSGALHAENGVVAAAF